MKTTETVVLIDCYVRTAAHGRHFRFEFQKNRETSIIGAG
jgi:hypothetical protein